MKTNITIFVFFILLASNALAQTFKHAIRPNVGNSLLDCLNINVTPTPNAPIDNPFLQKIVDSNYCEGYVVGVVHSITIKDNNGIGIDGMNPPLACPRQGVTFAQTKDIIKNYLYAHPESRDKNSSRLILAAMQEAFPCSNTPVPPSTPAPTGTPGPTK